ncbi:MAG TPA: signal recognition particle-docking protein FtsY [Candidatus Aminicenantes bacterium]|nr:signal recognition particle-docking protein FtsY [Acidobacteriota bacterium]HOY98229.1 signal recognition particle-docking protein FtsY [Candidatus Aminicenantes bacterium]HPN15783.1 signal recognition particle-docking protein FtsY [Candidatus Aminicenantes bacterium]HQF97685.1 signal recognition particle-docking protein FtsY [Candidatus Aminicenantes bacterium]
MLGRLWEGLAKTRQAWKDRFGKVFGPGRPREEILETLSESLILADAGVPVAEKITAAVRNRTKKNDDAETLESVLKSELIELLSRRQIRDEGPGLSGVILLVGVNGGGKTTTAAKIAQRAAAEGKRVLLVAADTFRAAAQEQLAIWGRRLGVPVHQGRPGSDPAAVVFDAAREFLAGGYDLMIVDTAGRIHTNANLMSELDKIKRIVSREIDGRPVETWLILDAALGQNALVQAREFRKCAGLSGLVLTKLDGTARGGAVLAIADEYNLPIRLVGTGEGAEDMEDFDPAAFVEALMS